MKTLKRTSRLRSRNITANSGLFFAPNIMKTQTVLKNIAANKELQKNMKKLSHFDDNQFVNNALAYIKAIRERRMLCVIESVSASGMSRVMKFHSFEIYKKKGNYGRGYYRNYYAFFEAMGFTPAKNSDGFRINGCGMDMVFHTNYTIIHDLHRLGFITKEECDKLAQETPAKL